VKVIEAEEFINKTAYRASNAPLPHTDKGAVERLALKLVINPASIFLRERS
jgi:hypothetical protein